MRYMRIITTCTILAVLFALAATGAIYAADAKGELTFSASLFNPDAGSMVWSGTGEYLFPLGDSTFLFGPSISLFDGGGFDGGAAGVAAEFNFGKKCGPGIGGAAHKLTGDAADQADYTYEARAFFKCGSEHAFVKFTASQVWSKAESGATTDPDGTSVQGGLGWRF